MIGDMIPFRIVGNVYFVGTYQASSHMIDTGDGLILIDVGYEETADVVIESLMMFGTCATFFCLTDTAIIRTVCRGSSQNREPRAFCLRMT